MISGTEKRPDVFLWDGRRIPVYGECVIFADKEPGVLIDQESREAAGYTEQSRRHCYRPNRL